MTFAQAVCASGPAVWDDYRPRTEWYSHDEFGIHGRAHSARVLVWANLIGAWIRERGIDIDLESIRWSASLHDVRRLTQGADPLHGRRCAEWLTQTRDPVMEAMGGERRARTAYCCEWHVPADSDAPDMTPELVCLKDADALDRARLGGVDLRFLRTALAKGLAAPAQFLCDSSEVRPEYRNDPWGAVRTAASEMGSWGIERGSEEICRRLRYFGW